MKRSLKCGVMLAGALAVLAGDIGAAVADGVLTIGRREDTRTVLDKLQLALDRGFIVSIDLIYGLPGQTLSGFVHDIETAISAGLDGCSLYHLNASARNRTFISTHAADQRSALTDYLFFQVGEQVLRARGYRKNHFAHFARPRDRNLYYTHVVRNEDLIALGTSHPCLTFDKWRQGCIVDEGLEVVETFATCF